MSRYGHAEKVWSFLCYDQSNKLLSGNDPSTGCGPVPLFKEPEPKVEKAKEGETPKENVKRKSRLSLLIVFALGYNEPTRREDSKERRDSTGLSRGQIGRFGQIWFCERKEERIGTRPEHRGRRFDRVRGGSKHSRSTENDCSGQCLSSGTGTFLFLQRRSQSKRTIQTVQHQ